MPHLILSQPTSLVEHHERHHNPVETSIKSLLLAIIIEREIRGRTLEIYSIPVLLQFMFILLPVVTPLIINTFRYLILEIGTRLETTVGRHQHHLGNAAITQSLQNLVFHVL